jgi:hypothetical protein
LIDLTQFEQAGYRVRLDEKKSYYYQRMIDLLGGLEQVHLFRHDCLLRLFSNAQFKKGRAYTSEELKTLAAPKDKTELFFDTLMWLAGKHILLRGYNLHCPACHLDHWYPLANVVEHMTCWGCGTVFQMPLQHEFAYRLNQHFIEGLNQGAATVLLTALYLSEGCQETFDWQTGLLFERDGQTVDIDLIAECNGRLILAECKNDLKGDVIDQLRRGVEVAKRCKASIYVFAVLQDQPLPQSLIEFAEEAGGQYPIHLVTRDALMGHGEKLTLQELK